MINIIYNTKKDIKRVLITAAKQLRTFPTVEIARDFNGKTISKLGILVNQNDSRAIIMHKNGLYAYCLVASECKEYPFQMKHPLKSAKCEASNLQYLTYGWKALNLIQDPALIDSPCYEKAKELEYTDEVIKSDID